MENTNILDIFEQYVTSDKYNETHSPDNENELEQFCNRFHEKINTLVPGVEAKTMSDELVDLRLLIEQDGFINGFKYAFKLAQECFAN